jgi:hypothetical protein
MRIAGLIVMLVLCSFLAFRTLVNAPIPRGPGAIAPAEPLQQGLIQPLSFAKGAFRATALARFELTARVILKQEYNDYGAQIAPVDLALGWGPMSDSNILQGLRFGQSDRFYFYEWNADPPLAPEHIGYYSANMHLIPPDATMERILRGLRSGNVIKLRGYLVRVDGPDGFYWMSSLTRTDGGNGACELVWVESLEVW